MSLQALHNDKTFSVGDTIRVYQKIQEQTTKGIKTRLQPFQGIVISARGIGTNKSFTVRRIGSGRIGIERIYPLFSPIVDHIEVINKGATKRSKLYYLRQKSQKELTELTKKYAKKKALQAKPQAPKKQKTTLK